MITIYTSPSCSSCKKVKLWFKEQEIPFVEKNIFSHVFNEKDLKDILSKSENGTDDIVSNRSKIIKENNINVEDMSILELIKFMKENPSILKRPIIVDDHKIQVGYNEDDIRAFIPHAKRVAAWACLECPSKDSCEHMNVVEDEDN